ncbi:hypothetical protein F383_01636 [Gossypium arboreum]|uniref:Uncharacterized protein n=1 Tax=Gossypium arboreum TaxID=29729 RepID=A0A0B0MX07_GOSAR|nr:hypothetical protein F383_01636 [Gossypium arboreum]
MNLNLYLYLTVHMILYVCMINAVGLYTEFT